MQPIEWPANISFDKRAFTHGFPFLGPHTRILKEAKSLLNQRNKDNVSALWLENEFIIADEVREKIFSVAASYLNWPNHLFIPADRAAIVFGFIPGMWIDPEDIIGDIAEMYNIDWFSPTDLAVGLKRTGTENRRKCAEIYESVLQDTLIDFFRLLEQNRIPD